MLESLNENQELEYQKLSPEEQEKRGILGRLVGVIADFKNPTRNGRSYSEALWEKVFSNPITKEKIENRLCFGENTHPVDRQEIDMDKISICLAEMPRKGKDGKLYGVFDILNTPAGKILKTLCDYGSNIGVSSRGSGDTYLDQYGNESVNPDTYEFVGFDAVLIPAVKEARPVFVNESLGNKTLTQALCESLESASAEDKKVMEESLADLGINLNQQDDEEKECNNQDDCADKEVQDELEVANDKSKEILNELQETLKQNSKLESEIVELQEKLSVSYAKEANTEEELSKFKKAVGRLSESASKVSALEEKISKLGEELEASKSTNLELQSEIRRLTENFKLSSNKRQALSEDLVNKSNDIKELNEHVSALTKDKESLNESINELKKDLDLKKTDYAKKISNANKLVENYKKIATRAVDKYIGSQASKLGIDKNEIKNKLPESYTFDDIDKICEDLQSYKLTRSKLPFQTGLTESLRVNVKPSKNEGLILNSEEQDIIDDSLLRLAKLK